MLTVDFSNVVILQLQNFYCIFSDRPIAHNWAFKDFTPDRSGVKFWKIYLCLIHHLSRLWHQPELTCWSRKALTRKAATRTIVTLEEIKRSTTLVGESHDRTFGRAARRKQLLNENWSWFVTSDEEDTSAIRSVLVKGMQNQMFYWKTTAVHPPWTQNHNMMHVGGY